MSKKQIEHILLLFLIASVLFISSCHDKITKIDESESTVSVPSHQSTKDEAEH